MNHTDLFMPVFLLKVYQRPHSGQSYIEVHDVNQVPGGFREGAGRPLTMDVWKNLALLSKSEDKKKEAFQDKILPPSLIAFDDSQIGRYICWYQRSMVRNITMQDRGVHEYQVQMPATLYYVYNGRLQIYALKSNARPGLNTELFTMPIPNQIGDGAFCWGNIDTKAKVKRLTIDQEMREWNTLVWNTMFDTHNGGQYLKLDKQLSKEKKRYPKKLLVSTNKRLNDILK